MLDFFLNLTGFLKVFVFVFMTMFLQEIDDFRPILGHVNTCDLCIEGPLSLIKLLLQSSLVYLSRDFLLQKGQKRQVRLTQLVASFSNFPNLVCDRTLHGERCRVN
jgi:hypothetical protein